jgi:hypothetical protein
LHEYEIPDLDIPVAVLIRRTGRTTRNVRTVIVEDLATRTAWARISHRPEIVLCAHAREAIRFDLDFIEPDFCGFIVILVDRYPQSVLRQAEIDRQKFPGELDCFLLEIVAKAEVAEHLEECVMPCRVSDVFKIIVLAAGANASLRCNRSLVISFVEAQEDVLELDHACIGEKQRGIVGRHERRAGNDLVAPLPEEFQKSLAQLIAGHGFHRKIIGLLPANASR